MAHSVRRHLRLQIDAYDESIRKWIPGYLPMLRAAAFAVAEVAPEHVLDLGAGTGGLSEVLLSHPEVGRVELLDVDREMLDRARARLASHGERVVFTEASFGEDLPVCDAVAASLSLHHLPTVQSKTELYARVFSALRPGGVFVNADATMPADPIAADEAYLTWAEHMIASGIPRITAWDHFAEWAEDDNYLPLDVEIQALTSVGFAACCVWQEAHMAVLVGRKPG
jgi:tRNA (cmo5U34)-methyltransferase